MTASSLKLTTLAPEYIVLVLSSATNFCAVAALTTGSFQWKYLS